MAMKGKGKGVKKHAPRHVTLLVSVEGKPFFFKSRMIWFESLVENLRPTRSLWGIEDRDRWE